MPEVKRTITTTVDIDQEELDCIVRKAVGAPDDAAVRFEQFDGVQIEWRVEEPSQ